MGHPRLFKYQPALLRHKLREARRISRKVHESENELIALLREFDEHRFFIRAGYRSLRTYCIRGLKISRTQAQRIVTQVRRLQTTFDIVVERDSSLGTSDSVRNRLGPTQGMSSLGKQPRHKTIHDYDEVAPPYYRFQEEE